jgi:branched-chain amino acid transport system substrate-binding protein
MELLLQSQIYKEVVMKRSFFVKSLIVTGIILFCCFSFLSNSFAKEPIKIGCTFDFSGVTAQFGVIEIPVVKMVLEELNKAGGIDGRPVELFVLDNGSDPAKMIANLKLLKQKHKSVAMFIGVTSTVNLAAKPWLEKNQIPAISPDPMSDRLWQHEGKSWFFRTQIPNLLAVERVLKRAKDLGHTKIGFEGSTLAWSTDALSAVKKMAPKAGLDFVGEALCEPKSKDLTIQAKNLRATGATAVVMAEYEAELGVWARALKNIGWNPYLISLSGGNLYATASMYSPELFEGWETIQLIDTTKPLVQEVWKKYEAYTGKSVLDEKAPRTWDAIQLLIEAIKLSGNPDDSAAIRDAFYKIKNFPVATGSKTTTGSFEIGRNHLLTVDDIPVYVMKSGKLVPVQ